MGWRIERADLAACQRLGESLGHWADPGLVVALIGPLGAGKTTLVRSVAKGLDVPDERVVSSPTFILVHEYEGRLPLYHFDVYRLNDPLAQFANLGPEEYFEGDGVSMVEWADRVAPLLPADRLEIHLKTLGPDHRAIEVLALGNRWSTLTQQLGEIMGATPRP